VPTASAKGSTITKQQIVTWLKTTGHIVDLKMRAKVRAIEPGLGLITTDNKLYFTQNIYTANVFSYTANLFCYYICF
jgi:hypothetical protein